MMRFFGIVCVFLLVGCDPYPHGFTCTQSKGNVEGLVTSTTGETYVIGCSTSDPVNPMFSEGISKTIDHFIERDNAE